MMASRASVLPPKALVGMVHVHALPGTPHNNKTVQQIIDIAVSESVALERAGFDAIILENMHDTPYLNREVGPEIVACMTAVCAAVHHAVHIPIGIQVLAGANRAALAVAQAGGASFCRCEGFVFAHVADEGMMNSDAGMLLRYRRQIGADNIAIYADIKKKHSAHAITADVSIAETAKAAHFFNADGVIVTGVATGDPCSVDDVRNTSQALPQGAMKTLVGSGLCIPLKWMVP
ncbi:putative BtpA family membrane complex biogenesis protein [Paratrimastix pyriformis]|uniref:BtpA family membrane complex biogenesis protein n=1 Tax=Paratrimastix pyriformis TaxID=342808 RepID=A0ABQ8UFZ8_9EUKA|nr:putative BtpA family membrane complex biogenesis protein [Paratrimastix pyriformis]